MNKSVLAVSIGMQILRNTLSRPLKTNKSNNVLVVSNGHLGDFIHSIPMIKVLSANNNVKVLTIESNKINNFGDDFSYIDEKEAIKSKWDLILVCSDNGKTRFRGNVVYLDGIRAWKKIIKKWHEKHWAEFYLDIAQMYDKTLNKELWGHHTLLKDIISSMQLYSDDTGLVVIHPGASSNDKSWCLESYLELYLNLKEAGVNVELLVTKFDTFVLDALKAHKDVKEFKGFYVEDLKGMTEVAKRTTMFVGNDSGVMHFFSLFTCSVLGIFTYGCADSHYPWTNKGYFYFERDVFTSFYKKHIVKKINLSVNVVFNEVMFILRGKGLTGDNKNFFDSEELMEYV